jgi:gamma-glutamyltranspeptidase/glutathione hydrolase
VVNPEAGNIGGGGFLVLRASDGSTASLDFRKKAPLAATATMFLDDRGQLTERSRVGHLASGVPGSVAGMWQAHHRFGTRSWVELLQPAINLAEGIVVHERLSQSLQAHESDLRRFPSTAALFLTNGRAPAVGDRLVQRDLAATLRRIAVGGKDGFYLGRTADLIDAEMRRGGGIISREDLRQYDAVWRNPVVFEYRGRTIVSMPPPSSGGCTVAEILNILEGFDLRSAGHMTSRHVHLWTEAVKLAFADRNAYFGDPDFDVQPVGRMISDEYAAERRTSIQMDRATPSSSVRPGLSDIAPGAIPAQTSEPQHTTHYSVIDKRGTAVAVTTTINSLYGNLVAVDGAGFLLNNEMDDFAAKPGTPNQFGLVQGAVNVIAPKKRMLSAMTPTIMLGADGQVQLVTGSPGGPTIITTVAQLISNIVDFGMNLEDATAAPRLHHQHLPDVLYYERNGLPSAVVSALQALGHSVEERAGFQGDTQSIALTSGRTFVGVADPRRGGAAVAVRQASEVVQ